MPVIAREILAGRTGAPRDIVLLNAGGGAVHRRRRPPPSATGIATAAEAIDSGRAAGALATLITLSTGGRPAVTS